VATLTHLIAYCAQQASTNLQEMVIARTATRARTVLLQDYPVKHRARAAARASTGLLQDKPLNHRARPVPTTRTRLLRALLRPPALAMQATVATPEQGIAHRAEQASGNLQETMLLALTAVRANTGPIQDKPLRHRARHVPHTRTRFLEALLRAPALATRATVATPGQGIAQRAKQASTKL
jgi:hypothetical protein